MGKEKTQKTTQERLTEGISILKQLREGGVKENGDGFLLLKQQISEWVKSGIAWSGTIAFPEHGRIAEVNLPKYNNRPADLNFKVKH